MIGGGTERVTDSFDVSWQLDGITMEGTVVRPDGDGPFPAVILVAGSGPTDRDWCSPVVPGRHGSGRLIAEALAQAGIASLRYDKRASGPHAMDSATKLLGKISMQSHLDELVAAVQVLTGLDMIDSSRIVGLGHSEGALHVLRYATSTQEVPFAGLMLAAPPGRPIQQVLLSQLAHQLAQIPGGAEFLPMIEEAAARYASGEPMNPDPALPDSIKTLLAGFEAPMNLPFARELWVESASDYLSRVRIPTLVLIGGRDIQVEVYADGEPLQEAAASNPNITFAFPPTANHVFKRDTRDPADITASPLSGYNTDGSQLDPDSLGVILTWLGKTFDRTVLPA